MEHQKNNAVEKVENVAQNIDNEKTQRENIKEIEREERARRKLHIKEEKARQKATLKRERERKIQEEINLRHERFLAKKQARELRAKNRQKNRENGRSYGGWLTAVISLGITTVALAGALTFVLVTPSEESTMLEAGYQRAFYDTIEQVDNIDLNLSKTLATSDKGAMQNYLLDLAVNAELAENNIQQLPLNDENKFYTTKLINQIADFSKYLNKKLINGEELSDKDVEMLNSLYTMNLQLKDSLSNMVSDMTGDFSFLSLGEGKGNAVIDNFNQLENLSVEYPELIYDGPFSDGKENREIKGLSGEEINGERAKEIFSSIFAGYNLEEIEEVGMNNSKINCYNVQAMVNGDNLFAQISVKGGKLILFDYSGSCNDTVIDRAEAQRVADEFLLKNDLVELKPVWFNLTGNVYTINYAYEEGGVIVYSDLVKVRVCAETAMVIGMEASSYYTNHTERTIGEPQITMEQAERSLITGMEVETARLAVVPIGENAEKLCYEFSGNYKDATYYIYIDTITGRQVEMFKVIESTEGTLLM